MVVIEVAECRDTFLSKLPPKQLDVNATSISVEMLVRFFVRQPEGSLHLYYNMVIITQST